MANEETLQGLSDMFAEKQGSYVAFDMWGSCTPQNIREKIQRTSTLKPLHQQLLRHFVSACKGAGVEAFVYAGTALGVFREGGRMIAFDYDADFAALEHPFTLSRLANYCLQQSSDFKVTGVDGLNSDQSDDARIQVDFSNTLSNTSWLHIDPKGEVRERPYCGRGAKTTKFIFTKHGLLEAARNVGIADSPIVEEIADNLTEIHIDLFTLSSHPDSPEQHLRINWHKGVVYDSLKKRFSRKHFFPLQRAVFEGVEVLAPVDLESYLKEEYGYLGRDAMYDSATQLYTKIPAEVREKLPNVYSEYLSETPVGSSCTE